MHEGIHLRGDGTQKSLIHFLVVSKLLFGVGFLRRFDAGEDCFSFWRSHVDLQQLCVVSRQLCVDTAPKEGSKINPFKLGKRDIKRLGTKRLVTKVF
jgi:hypothetical protein